MPTDVLAPTTSGHAALQPGNASGRSGPVTVALGRAEASVLEAAAAVARALDRGLAVISVLEPVAVYLWNPPGLPVPPDLEEQRIASRWRLLEEHLRERPGEHPPWSIEVRWGSSVSRTIARAARDLRSPVIVMGHGRHRPIDRLLGTETALRTVRHADCPVFAAAPGFTGVTRAVLGVDFSDASAHAVRAVLPLLEPEGTLHLVHAWLPTRPQEARSPYDESYREELPSRFRRFVAALDLPASVAVETDIVEGPAAERLVELAERAHADLVVVGRHGRGMIERLLVGSVATRVLRGAPCSVLVVPEPDPAAQLQLAERRGASSRQVPREQWHSHLDAFARRFAGHVTALEVTDPPRGQQSREQGYVLFGTSYDPGRHRLEIILGEAHGRRRHLTRIIPDASGVAALRNAAGEEDGLHIVHGTGDTLLTLVPTHVAVHALTRGKVLTPARRTPDTISGVIPTAVRVPACDREGSGQPLARRPSLPPG